MMETALYISESPVGSNYNTMEQTFHTQTMTTSSSAEFHTMSSNDSSGNFETETKVLSRGPVNATNDIQQLDANHNRTDFKKMDMDQRASSLRRIQSESATAEYKTNTLPIYGREHATAQIVQVKPARKSESVTAEIKGRGGKELVTAEVVRRRENGHWSGRREQHVQFVEGKCTCCPYGYHVDLDFVNYCESLSDGSYLSKLKRIEREKRKLRKSMEVFLKQQEQGNEYTSNTESANFIRTIDYQNSATNKMLDEIDSSVDNTIHSIDRMYVLKYASDSSEGTSNSTSPRDSAKFSTFPRSRGKNIQEEITQYNTGLVTTGLNDSQNSISSISTLSSEKASPMFSSYGQSSSVSVHDETTFQRITQITSDQLAETMATHLPSDNGAASPQSNTTNISKQSLHAIREAMAVSLQKMKELEEQVKALPVLQVRISVLKEEKRLLELKLKAKDRKPATRSVGVGVEEVKQKSPPPTPPKKVRMVGVGDHSVLEPYLLQPHLPESYTIRDNEMFSKETYVLEREKSQTAVYSPFRPPKPLTRTIGIGDANVFDDGLKIHEKELRTVILGQAQNVGRRNVGVECRVHTRDVGVSYAFDDEKPTTRTVGVGVNLDYGLVNFKSEEMRTALQTVLHRNVRSIGITCDVRPQRVDTGIQYSNYSLRSIGVGDSNIDVEVRMPVAKRTVGVNTQTTLVNKSVNTDHGWKLDASTNTARLFTDNKSSMTERMRQNNTATMTEEKAAVTDTTQTEHRMFMYTEQIKNVGSNTQKVRTSTTAMNTDIERKPMQFNKYVSTEQVRMRDIGIGDGRIDSFVCSFDDEEATMEETTEEIVYTTEEKIVESGWTDQTKAQQLLRKFETYDDESGNASMKAITSSEETPVSFIKQQLDSSHTEKDKKSKVSTKEKSYREKDEEVVEKKITSQGDGGNYTVTTITTRKSLGDDQHKSPRGPRSPELSRKVVLRGEEILKGPEIRKILGSESSTEHVDISGSGGGSADGGYQRRKIKISGSVAAGGVDNIEQTDVYGGDSGGVSSGGYTSRHIITRSSTGGTRTSPSDFSFSDGGQEISSSSSLQRGGNFDSQEMSSGGSRQEYTTTVIRSSDISGDTSNISDSFTKSERASRLKAELDELGANLLSSSQKSSSGSGGSSSEGDGDELVTETIVMDIPVSSIGKSYYEKYLDMTDGANRSSGDRSSSDGGLTIENIHTRSSSGGEEQRSGGILKSCIKKSKEDTQSKKGITFAENVTGGYTSSSTEEDSSEEEGSESSSDDDSYEEGSYDSREGSIVYQCKDDEAIAQGVPGAMMFDQNIRETYELSEEMRKSCEILAKYLEDSTEVQTKELNKSLNIIQQDWFKISSQKLSETHQVEDFLSCFNEISPRLLEYVVNMQDSNGNTAVHYAVSHCNFEIVSLLLDTGVVDLNKQNKAGYTSTMLATLAYTQTERQGEVVQRLFSMGDIDATASKDGQTALMLAASQGRTEMVKMLLDSGASVNTQDNEGSTAMMCACEHGHTDIVKLLLAQPDCDASAADNDGSTPLSIAMEAGHKDIGVLLYAHLNFTRQVQPSPGFMKKRKSSNNTSPLPSPTIR